VVLEGVIESSQQKREESYRNRRFGEKGKRKGEGRRDYVFNGFGLERKIKEKDLGE